MIGCRIGEFPLTRAALVASGILLAFGVVFMVIAFGLLGAMVGCKATITGGWAGFGVCFALGFFALLFGGLIYGNIIPVPENQNLRVDDEARMAAAFERNPEAFLSELAGAGGLGGLLGGTAGQPGVALTDGSQQGTAPSVGSLSQQLFPSSSGVI